MLDDYEISGGYVDADQFGRIHRLNCVSESLITCDDAWLGFLESIPEAARLARMSDRDLSVAFAMPETFLATLVPRAIRLWRHSPSRSVIQIVGPVEGARGRGPMFHSIRSQTRILAAAAVAGAIPMHVLRGIRAPDGRAMEGFSDSPALTVDAAALRAINDLARAFYLWERRNRARIDCGLIKRPKMLYRAVREIRGGPGQMEVGRAGEHHYIRIARHAERVRGWLATVPFVDASPTNILSFTSSVDIARKFVKGKGFIIAVDPRKVDLVASHATDKALDGRDEVLKVHEREWIARIPDDLVLDPMDIRICQQEYLVATRSPDAIAGIDHLTTAYYSIDGRRIRRRNSPSANGGRPRHYHFVDDEYGGSRKETIDRIGFDPEPGIGREASDVWFAHRQWLYGDEHPIPRYEAETYEMRTTEDPLNLIRP